MPTPDMPTYPLYATTPSLGVRVWIEAGEVCLHVGSEGGRGVPRRLVLMPVTMTAAGQPKPRLDLKAVYADPEKRRAFRAQHRTPAATLFAPFTERFGFQTWSEITAVDPLLLAILLFRQIDTSEVANLAAPDAYDGGADWQSELGALVALFAKPRPTAWLRRGLVWLDPSDVPMGTAESAPAEPPLQMTFALASCQYPAGLLDGTPQEFGRALPGPADASMLRLSARLASTEDPQRPSLLVLGGDQIYADATAGLFDPRARPNPGALDPERIDEDWLRVPYQNWLGSVGAQSVLGRVRTFMVLDDHEIRDNWEPVPPPADKANDDLRKAGLEAYGRYQRNRPGGLSLPRAWQRLSHRGIEFFLADTRTERQARKAALKPKAEAPRIMSARQAKILTAWLTCTIGRPAFVVSPSMLLPRRRLSARHPQAALHSDAWDGYPASLHALLAAVWRTERSDLVFLSGDEHLSCIAHITVSNLVIDLAQTRSVTLHSVHSSGLYAPWPFANSVPELFAETDDWCFNDPNDPPTRLRCQVEVLQWVPGDGFACLSLQRGNAGNWNLTVAFDRAHAAPKPRTLHLRRQD